MHSMKFIQSFLLLSFLFALSLWSATPVPYSGKIDIHGVNYFGEAQFAFSLHDGNGTTHWRNGNQPKETIKVTIRNGRYSVLLGGQGMNSLPPELFLNHDKLYLKVEFDNEDGEGLRHLAPDQLITATPRALVAEVARVAQVAEKVGNGAITRDMLSSEVLAQLDANATASPSTPVTITRDMLPASLLNDLNKTVAITRDMLPQDVRDDLNRTVTITRSMLPADVLSDLNRTISKSMLGSDVLADLNKSSTTSSPITLSMLAPEVTAKLDQNGSGGAGVVTGSIISVPYGQSAPAGYSLYQRGEPKEAQLVWQEKNPLSLARFVYDGVEVIGGKIYVVGGQSTNQLDRLERYDPATSNWEVLSNLPEPRSHICAAVVDGMLYVIGGISNSGFLSSVAIYDPSNDQWSSGTALPEVNSAACAVTYDDKIYVIGGKNSSSSRHNKVFEYSPQSNSWSQKTSMPINNEGHKAIVWRDRIWVIGGYAGSSVSINSVYSYDPTTDIWRTEAPLSKTRVWHSIWAINDQLYVGGGGFGDAYQTIEIYDSLGSKWDELPDSLPQNSYVSGAAVLGNSLYLLGGSTSTSPTDISNKVFAADLSTSVEGVYDLYRKTITKEILAPDILSDLNATIGLDRLSSEAISELNSSGLEDNSVTMAKLEPQLRADLNKTTSRPFGATLANPYGILGTPVVSSDTSYSVPVGKVLVIVSSGDYVKVNSKTIRGISNNTSILPGGTEITNNLGWTGFLFEPLNGITPIVFTDISYNVPEGKTLVVTSSGEGVYANSMRLRWYQAHSSLVPSATNLTQGSSYGWTGYLIDPTKF